MKNSNAAFGVNRALVISDDVRLARAIALILDSCLGIESMELEQGSQRQGESPAGDGYLDLIVLALSSVHSEPLVLLSRASLGAEIGRVPILIVSERAFSSCPGDNVFHVDLASAARKLCDRVRDIARGNLGNPTAQGVLPRASFVRAHTKLLPRL